MLTFMEFCNIRLRTISQEVFMNLIRNMCSDIMLLKLLPHLTEASGLVLAMSKDLLPTYQSWKFQCEDEMISLASYLHNGIS